MKALQYLLFYCLMIPAICQKSPNVILIMTDDQGYGDLGFTGNSQIKTPVLDQFARESIRFNNFYVSPVCSPTRASLLTGRYSLRTGVRDTYNGGSMMASEEITTAEMLKSAGYQTGIFGKWHLGDNYPFRPNDQGFDESVIHKAGGIGQPGDVTNYFAKDSSYFDPILWHNGQTEAYEGYCSDIFTTEAIEFIERNKETPFFCYLAFNAPHNPLQVPAKYYEMYANIDPAVAFGDSIKAGEMTKAEKEKTRKVYGMVTNIDDNIGRLLHRLKELEIEENTIVIFMTDNGPQHRRYNGGMRGKKGNVFRGGVRVPFFFRYPQGYVGNRDIETSGIHLDLLPTLAELCNAKMPADRVMDGRSLAPLLQEEAIDWENRPLFFYWTRQYPEPYNNIAVQKGDYKLVGRTDYNASINDFELFNLKKDPSETTNLIPEQANIANELRGLFDNWYQEMIGSNHLVNPPSIVIGSNYESPTLLNRNDASGERGIWTQEDVYGKWQVSVKEGLYNFKFKFLNPVDPNGKMYLQVGSFVYQTKNNHSADLIELKNVSLPAMECELIPFYKSPGKRAFPLWVEAEKIN